MIQGTDILIRVDNTPAEDEAYTIGMVQCPIDMNLEDGEAKIRELREQWREEFPEGEDQHFLEYLEEHGFTEVTPPREMIL